MLAGIASALARLFFTFLKSFAKTPWFWYDDHFFALFAPSAVKLLFVLPLSVDRGRALWSFLRTYPRGAQTAGAVNISSYAGGDCFSFGAFIFYILESFVKTP
jgi:hypothetical protein